jgi:hypothetical protein
MEKLKSTFIKNKCSTMHGWAHDAYNGYSKLGGKLWPPWPLTVLLERAYNMIDGRSHWTSSETHLQLLFAQKLIWRWYGWRAHLDFLSCVWWIVCNFSLPNIMGIRLCNILSCVWWIEWRVMENFKNTFIRTSVLLCKIIYQMERIHKNFLI